MRDHLLEADIIYGDETTVRVLTEPERAARRKLAAPYAGIKFGAVLMTNVYEPYSD